MTTIFDGPWGDDVGGLFPQLDVPRRGSDRLLGERFQRTLPLRMPDLSEPQVARHYTKLSKMNFGVDDGVYPLGSCTMKYNPKLNEEIAALPGFSCLHPRNDPEAAQGALEVLFELTEILKGVAGMADVSLQPVAGAHGEMTGMLLFKKHFEMRGEAGRTRILLPDTAHGTNPASAAMAGFSVTEVASDSSGRIDLDALNAALDETVAGVMLTVPNTLGIFETNILRVTERVHQAGGLCYFDGANLNSFLGKARPGDMGADVFHFNLHKTMSTPHGGGGPGAGPIAVSDLLADCLPVPRVVRRGKAYALDWEVPHSVGSVHSFYGNFLVAVKAFAYILQLGDDGLREVAENAVLNANYLQHRLKRTYPLPYDGLCKHEFVLSGKGLADDVSTLDIAKRMIDYGIHPPTVYFPLTVREALMIEPTETESKATLDHLADILEAIADEAQRDPQLLHDAPHRAPVRRLDQTQAAKHPMLTYPFGEAGDRAA